MQLRTLSRKLVTLDRAIISDILLWLALLVLTVGALYYFAFVLPNRQGQAITLRFHDASAIIPGSPVHMLGLEVGHVASLDMGDGFVDVKIVTEPDMPPIPPGTSFTILFTGLGGSESIEATLPDKPLISPLGSQVDSQNYRTDHNSPNSTAGFSSATGVPMPTNGGPSTGYSVSEPIRLREVLNTNVKVVRALQQGSENMTEFFGSTRSVEELQYNAKQAHEWSKSSLAFLDSFEKQKNVAQESLKMQTTDGLKQVEGVSRTLGQVRKVTDPSRINGYVRQVREARQNFPKLHCENGVCTFESSNVRFSCANVPVERLKNGVLNSYDAVAALNVKQPGTIQQLQSLNQSLDNNQIGQILQQCQASMQNFNTKIYPELDRTVNRAFTPKK